MTAMLDSQQTTAPALLTTLDEAVSVLDTFITKRQELTRITVVCSESYATAHAAEHDERQCARRATELEQRLKSQGCQVIFGTVKPGDLAAVKAELETTRLALGQHQQVLGDRREALCTAESARTEVLAELQRLRGQLAKYLPTLFANRFGQAEPNLGVRGQVVWAEQDSTGAAQYRRTWRTRVFRDLFRRVLNLSEDLALLFALRALVTEGRFRVRIVSGFILSRSGGHDVPFVEVGNAIAVPNELTFEDAFEELVRGRVRFLVES